MTGPRNIKLPFFAYGVFRTGELGFLSMANLVYRVVEPACVRGDLRIRDGLPIIDPAGRSRSRMRQCGINLVKGLYLLGDD